MCIKAADLNMHTVSHHNILTTNLALDECTQSCVSPTYLMFVCRCFLHWHGPFKSRSWHPAAVVARVLLLPPLLPCRRSARVQPCRRSALPAALLRTATAVGRWLAAVGRWLAAAAVSIRVVGQLPTAADAAYSRRRLVSHCARCQTMGDLERKVMTSGENEGARRAGHHHSPLARGRPPCGLFAAVIRKEKETSVSAAAGSHSVVGRQR